VKHTILITIRSVVLDKINAKSFLAEVADQFTKSDKVDVSTRLSKLVNMHYNGKKI